MLLCERDEGERPLKYTDKLKKTENAKKKHTHTETQSDLPFFGRERNISSVTQVEADMSQGH